MDTKVIRSKTASATRWSTISEIIAKLITPITNMILARLLTPEAFGVVATVTMIVSFADIFTDAGFQKYLIQHDFKDTTELDNHTNVAFWSNLIMSLVLWGGICVFSTPITVAVGNPGLEIVIIVASVSLPLTSFSSIQMARFKRDFNYKTLLPIRIASVLIPFCVTIPLAFLFRSYWALIVSTIVGNLTNAILLTIKSQWKPKFYFNISILKEMFSYSWWILLESISVWATNYIDTFIVGIFLSTYYVGLYKTSMSTVNQIMGLITAATSLPLFAALTRLKNDELSLKLTYLKYVKAVANFVIPLGIGIFLYRDLVVTILLGNQWDEATSFVGLWGSVYALTIVLGSYCNGLYNAVGKTYLSFISQLLQLIVLIPALLFAVQRGYECLYVVRSVVRLEIIFVQFIIMKYTFSIRVIDQIKTIIPATICSGFMVVVALILRKIAVGILWDVFSVLLCIIIYFIMMFVLYKNTLVESLEILGIKQMRR